MTWLPFLLNFYHSSLYVPQDICYASKWFFSGMFIHYESCCMVKSACDYFKEYPRDPITAKGVCYRQIGQTGKFLWAVSFCGQQIHWGGCLVPSKGSALQVSGKVVEHQYSREKRWNCMLWKISLVLSGYFIPLEAWASVLSSLSFCTIVRSPWSHQTWLTEIPVSHWGSKWMNVSWAF